MKSDLSIGLSVCSSPYWTRQSLAQICKGTTQHDMSECSVYTSSVSPEPALHWTACGSECVVSTGELQDDVKAHVMCLTVTAKHSVVKHLRTFTATYACYHQHRDLFWISAVQSCEEADILIKVESKWFLVPNTMQSHPMGQTGPAAGASGTPVTRLV